jgi:hypothetical protein
VVMCSPRVRSESCRRSWSARTSRPGCARARGRPRPARPP